MRFPEFDGEYEEKKLGEVCEINPQNRNIPDSFIYIDLESVVNGVLLKEDEISKNEAPSRAQRFLKNKDILFQMVRPYQKNNLFFDRVGDYVASTGYAQIRTKQNSQFIFQYLHNQKFVNNVIEKCTGTSYPAINSTDLSNINIFIPLIPEQNKISEILSLLDKRIEVSSKIIKNLQSLIKGICQSLMNNEEKIGWQKLYLREILTEREEANYEKYPIHSVSVSKGVINQIEYLGRSFAAKDTSNYNVVYFGDIVYTKSPTGDFPYGIIKQSFIEENVAVSPLYGVYTPQNIAIGNILHYYFSNPINTNNYLHSLIQKGAKNTINITNQHFLDKKIFLPIENNKIQLIATLLNTVSRKIEIETEIYQKFIEQKKYLLANMFI